MRRSVDRVFASALAAVVLVASLVGCGSSAAVASTSSSSSSSSRSSSPPTRAREAGALADGLYAVAAEGTEDDAPRFAERGWRVLTYDSGVVALDTRARVPLDLEGSPESAPDGRGRTLLNVTLRREHVATLREFTRAHLGGRVAIVLDGEIITLHKMRAVIDDGRMQITRCTDDACSVLRSRLTR